MKHGLFSWVGGGLERSPVKRHDNLSTATQLIQFENSRVMYLCWLKTESEINCQIDPSFSNLETCSHIPLSHRKAWLHVFLLLTGLCLANVSEPVNLSAITWVSTALYPPRVLISAQSRLILHRCSIGSKWWVHARGWAGPLGGAEPPWWWAWVRGWPRGKQSRQQAMCWTCLV